MFLWLVCNVHNLIKAAKRFKTELLGNSSGFSKLSGFKNIFNGEKLNQILLKIHILKRKMVNTKGTH